MSGRMNPIWVPLCAFNRHVIFCFYSGHKSGIIKRIGAVFLVFRCNAIRFFHAPILP